MKYFVILLTLLPFTCMSQSINIGIFGGPYWSNREVLNQETGGTFGLELAHEFNEKSQIMMRVNFGGNKYFEDRFNKFLQIETPNSGTNMTTKDINIALMYGRNFELNEKLKVNSGIGLSFISFDYDTRRFISVQNGNNNSQITLPIAPSSGDGLGFPLILGGEFQASFRWSFHLESSGIIEPDYGIISLYVGPKVKMRLTPNKK